MRFMDSRVNSPLPQAGIKQIFASRLRINHLVQELAMGAQSYASMVDTDLKLMEPLLFNRKV